MIEEVRTGRENEEGVREREKEPVGKEENDLSDITKSNSLLFVYILGLGVIFHCQFFDSQTFFRNILGNGEYHLQL